MSITLTWIAGISLGVLIFKLFDWIFSTPGILRIDHSNPEKDVYRFDIKDLDALSKKKRVRLKIDHHADLSQE